MLEARVLTDPATVVPKEYYNYLDIFFKEDLDILTLYRLYNYNILLLPGYKPLVSALYNYS